jgi:methyl-accepting chemotaxis protein
MRELAGGNFDVVLPGLGRRDELGEMAGAVEEFKMQAIAKAEHDAAAQEAQNKASSAARRGELIRFADEFEAAVGTIVSNVSSSAVQLESAAGTLTRTAETTQSLSSQVAGASEQASSNMQSVATATEELSTSVEEIGRRVRESNKIAEAAVLQAQQTDGRIGKLSRAAQEIGDVVKLILGMQGATQESVAAIKEIGGTIGQISGIASAIASAVEQQSSATQEIARSVQNVAQGTHEAAANIMQVNRGATETGSASEEVLNSAKTLSTESARLREELDRFMANIRAA